MGRGVAVRHARGRVRDRGSKVLLLLRETLSQPDNLPHGVFGCILEGRRCLDDISPLCLVRFCDNMREYCAFSRIISLL